MAEGLSALWENFNLTKEETMEMAVNHTMVAESLAEGKLCLIGKLLSRRAVNIDVMRNVLHMVWKLSGGLQVREIGEKLYIFQFESEVEKERVYQQGPWNFNKALLVLKNYDAFISVEEIKLEWCAFWIQVHDLPLGFMTESVGKAIGDSFGEVIEIDTCGDKVAWGKFLRIRACLNVNKPLRRGMILTAPNGGKILVSFRYEKLPDFCYVCGCLNHTENECEKAVIMRRDSGKVKKEYGPWLRAEVPRSNTLKFDGPGISETRTGKEKDFDQTVTSKQVIQRVGKEVGMEAGAKFKQGMLLMKDDFIHERPNDSQADNIGLIAANKGLNVTYKEGEMMETEVEKEPKTLLCSVPTTDPNQKLIEDQARLRENSFVFKAKNASNNSGGESNNGKRWKRAARSTDGSNRAHQSMKISGTKRAGSKGAGISASCSGLMVDEWGNIFEGDYGENSNLFYGIFQLE
ncbi:hypothetical protein COLO4_10561 [Corchorus olitorius]|uniref:DUF4283 domain-containing protein n=1 Tax=Corchorus olitorius TaxID=93759 RepID=A0A1R3K847_9ROSI|nr:hypothetical protein COLO4_10561 [Corchorus olitorius]